MEDEKRNEMNSEELTFESAMAQLKKIVSDLDNGDAPLDKSLELFEKAVGLVKFCNEKLDTAEQKVKMLTGNGVDNNG